MTNLSNFNDHGPSLEDRRQAASHALGCLLNPLWIGFLVIWTLFFIFFTVMVLLDAIRRAGDGVNAAPGLSNLLVLPLFGILVVLGWWAVGHAIASRRNPPAAGALVVIEREGCIELVERLPSAVFIGLLAAVAANFLFMVLYGNVMIALRPTISDKVRLSIQLASWGAALLAYVAASHFWKVRVRRVGPVFRLDVTGRTVAFRPFDRDESWETLRIPDIRAIDIETRATGDDTERKTSFVVRLHAGGQATEMRSHSFKKFDTRVQAKVCAQWLAWQFGLLSNGSQPPPTCV